MHIICANQGGTRPIFWDETETDKLGLSKTTTRPRVSVSFFMRLRREPTFNKEIDLLFDFISLKTTHPGEDETE